MTSVFQALLETKRAELAEAHRRYQDAEQDVTALERVAAMDLPLNLLVPADKYDATQLHGRRIDQVLDLLHRSGGTVHVRAVMAELQLSRTAARRFMNGVVDRFGDAAPWARVNGSRSEFVVRGFSPVDESSPADSGEIRSSIYGLPPEGGESA
jgi:hypothetical protein